MSKSAFIIDTPKDCLSCEMRKVLHIDNRYYQMCSLCKDRYCLESFFTEDDLVEGFKSEKCPLIIMKPYIGFDNASQTAAEEK
jgi:hypothetical protein